ncbi:MAG: ADOP family duplicated permease [Terracidiphilus sp.]|nr:ADOP family duplicated permease [Terracidiphilus sp.]
MLQNIRYAFRQLRKSPGFTLTAVLTLGLGLGSSAAIFCLMDTMWLHPMSVPHPARLARIFATTPQNQDGGFSYPEYRAMAERVNAFEGLTAVGGRGTLLARPDGTSLMLSTNVVSTNFFDVMGVRPMLGRAFTTADAARLRVRPGIVLSYAAWQHTFGGDAQIVGKQIPLRRGKDGLVQADVWGVLGPEFRDVDTGSDRDAWMPLESWTAFGGDADLTSRSFHWLNLIGRLAPGATAAQANQQAAVVASALRLSDPADNHDRGARVLSDLQYRLSQSGTSGVVLFAIVAGVVLLCTVNVAHLLLARGLTRGPEVALRISLGATRVRVAAQLLTENLLVGLMGLTAGMMLAMGLAMALPWLLVSEPAMLASYGDVQQFHVDWRVFAFAGTLALATMLLLALVPLAQVARPQLVSAMNAARSTAGRSSVARRVAVWVQIGVSFALLVSTGALVRSFLNTRTKPIGLTRDQVLVAFTQLPDDAERAVVMDRLRAVPGVQSVAYGIRSPLMPSEGGIAVKALLPSHPELREQVEIKFNAVSPDFLAVTGTRVVRGRGFMATDDAGPMAVVINRTMAEKYWPGQNPLGQSVLLRHGTVEAHVIGVAEDAPIIRIGETTAPYLYVPFQQYETQLSNMGEITFVLRTGPEAMSMAQAVRQALIHENPLLDPMFVTSQPELLRYSAGSYQMMAELVTVLGVIGLALTAVGLYGFLAFRITQRRREIGIRMALGASRQATARLVIRDAARLGAVGLALGVVLSAAAMRLESAVLFGVKPLDAWTLVGALAVLATAMAAAAWLPAQRAATVDPIQALRTE